MQEQEYEVSSLETVLDLRLKRDALELDEQPEDDGNEEEDQGFLTDTSVRSAARMMGVRKRVPYRELVAAMRPCDDREISAPIRQR